MVQFSIQMKAQSSTVVKKEENSTTSINGKLDLVLGMVEVTRTSKDTQQGKTLSVHARDLTDSQMLHQ